MGGGITPRSSLSLTGSGLGTGPVFRTKRKENSTDSPSAGGHPTDRLYPATRKVRPPQNSRRHPTPWHSAARQARTTRIYPTTHTKRAYATGGFRNRKLRSGTRNRRHTTGTNANHQENESAPHLLLPHDSPPPSDIPAHSPHPKNPNRRTRASPPAHRPRQAPEIPQQPEKPARHRWLQPKTDTDRPGQSFHTAIPPKQHTIPESVRTNVQPYRSYARMPGRSRSARYRFCKSRR